MTFSKTSMFKLQSDRLSQLGRETVVIKSQDLRFEILLSDLQQKKFTAIHLNINKVSTISISGCSSPGNVMELDVDHIGTGNRIILGGHFSARRVTWCVTKSHAAMQYLANHYKYIYIICSPYQPAIPLKRKRGKSMQIVTCTRILIWSRKKLRTQWQRTPS
jgi:hypothetical protein